MAFQPRKGYGHLNAKELLDLVKAGDEEAFAEFHERQRLELYKFCCSFTAWFRKKYGLEDYAEDLAQDVFVKVLLYASSFNDYGQTGYEELEVQAQKWLRKIARNTYLSTLRKYKNALRVYLEEWQLEEVHSSDGEDDVLDLLCTPDDSTLTSNRKAELILEAIEALPLRKRLVIDAVLNWCPDEIPPWAIRELADLLNIKPNSVIQIKIRLIKDIKLHVRSRLASQDEGDYGHQAPKR